MKTSPAASVPFTSYQKFVIFLLAVTQFTVVLDFMIMSPLGPMLMRSMKLAPHHFGYAVSAYAISAGISGLLAAGFADKYDRKKLLLFFYIGFIAGTMFCGMAHTYWLLLAARIITGLFGGVIGSISMAIITDLFDLQHRGRVIGFVQMGFGASQVMGIPISLWIANHMGWQMPFYMVAAFSGAIAIFIMVALRPVTGHLGVQRDRNIVSHLWHNITNRRHRIGFLATAMLSMGGFMMMPFGSAFAVNNLGITFDQLTFLFMVSGMGTFVIMPLIGKLSDRVDKFKLFAWASVWMCAIVLVYTHLTFAPLWLAIAFNITMMMGIMGRMVPSTTLVSAIPLPADRGAFMSINSSLQQIAGGIASAVSGMIVIQHGATSPLEHYDTMGYVVVALSLVAIWLVYRVSVMVKQTPDEEQPQWDFERESELVA